MFEFLYSSWALTDGGLNNHRIRHPGCEKYNISTCARPISALRLHVEITMSEKIWECSTHFFIMIYRNAFPKVWSSFKNSNEAAVSEDPGSW